MYIELTIKVKPERITNLIENAINGGISYWCSECTSNEDFKKLGREPDTFTEHADDIVHTLTHQKAVDGLSLMQEKYPHQFAAFMTEKDDADTADIFIQLCLFGEVVYG